MGLNEAAEAPPPVDLPEPDAISEEPSAEDSSGSLGAPPGPILPTDRPDVAGRKAMWLHVERMRQREAGLRDPNDTDALRRYRVATRRLRAALRVFRADYPPRQVRTLRSGLADLATAVGTTRDLDVRLADLERWAAAEPSGTAAGVEPLREAWSAERRVAAAAVERRLASQAHQRLMANLAEFVTSTSARTHRPPDEPARTIRDRTASAVWEAYERLRSYASVVPWADAAALHGLRIQAKRLRYTIEFLAELLGPDRAWAHTRLVALQDHLGLLNDATVASLAVRSFLAQHHGRLEPAARAAIERYLGHREREMTRLRRGLGRVWRPVVGITFARRLGRAVVIAPGP